MSSSSNTDVHIDLIDFHVGSPILPAITNPDHNNFLQEPDNLIDTELPAFEQKLQYASSSISCHSRRPSIDVEDILIDINSDDYDKDSLDGEEVERDFLDLCEGENGNNVTTLPVDNFEALLVLKNLDDLLNATLEESENALDLNRNPVEDEDDVMCSEEDSQQIIEDCLEDLDNYLKAIGDGDSESNESFTTEQSTTKESGNISELTGSNDTFDYNQEFNEELERNKLRLMEENYRKFVALGVVNRGYLDTEDQATQAERARPLSACAATNQLGNRKHAYRATTSAMTRKERPRLLNRRNSLTDANIAPHPILFRTSGTDAGTTPMPEDRLASRDVDQERHAHAPVDCCTGTVIVEPVRAQSTSSSSSVAFNDAPVHKDDTRTTNRGTWLRTSMRRLQQLNIPSADDGPSEGNEVSGDVRPVSAPSRLPSSNTSTGRSSRSRSRNSVSQEPSGRARSSSESSRSRRPRSLSSSVTSLASSVESTPSCMPQMERNRASTNGQESTTNSNTRRHQVLKALEEGKQEERAIRRAEKAARLAEEKRLSAEKDFEQIIAIFTPPPPPPPKIAVEDQGFFLGIKGSGPEQCESKYENIDKDDSNLNQKLESFDIQISESDKDKESITTDANAMDITEMKDHDNNETVEFKNESDGDTEANGYWIQDYSKDMPIMPDDKDSECAFEPKK